MQRQLARGEAAVLANLPRFQEDYAGAAEEEAAATFEVDPGALQAKRYVVSGQKEYLACCRQRKQLARAILCQHRVQRHLRRSVFQLFLLINGILNTLGRLQLLAAEPTHALGRTLQLQ